MSAYTYKDLMQEYRLFGDSSDKWGTVMSWLFNACDSLLFDHDQEAPPECHYRPSPMGRSNEDGELNADICKASDPDELYKFTRVLSRYEGLLRKHGHNY